MTDDNSLSFLFYSLDNVIGCSEQVSIRFVKTNPAKRKKDRMRIVLNQSVKAF